jgi:pimeloyl-ACP methyl ester carboxylesterase
MEDAPLVYDLVVERLRPERVVAVGVSLGSGVAASLAARRRLDGLILVTPFDSLSATARQLYPWLPVSLLLRHDMDSASLLRGTGQPVALIAAARDRLVRPGPPLCARPCPTWSSTRPFL